MGSVRIITGDFGGRTLSTPSSHATHPMSERARAGAFNALVSLGFRFNGAKVLDLFAGSGVLGLEAISRGAEQAIFVENHRRAIECVRENIELLNIYKDQARVMVRNAFSFEDKTQFDLVFCDPPYGDFEYNALRLMRLLDKLNASKDAILISSRPSTSESLELEEWRLIDSKEYADAGIDFYSKA
jgi:16S rRNA (guanine966-N2)-methyltransferase